MSAAVQRPSRRPLVTNESRREDVVQHLSARTKRLMAYEASLVEAQAKEQSARQAEQIERQLAQVRRELGAGSRPRLPRLAVPPPDGTAG